MKYSCKNYTLLPHPEIKQTHSFPLNLRVRKPQALIGIQPIAVTNIIFTTYSTCTQTKWYIYHNAKPNTLKPSANSTQNKCVQHTHTKYKSLGIAYNTFGGIFLTPCVTNLYFWISVWVLHLSINIFCYIQLYNILASFINQMLGLALW